MSLVILRKFELLWDTLLRIKKNKNLQLNGWRFFLYNFIIESWKLKKISKELSKKNVWRNPVEFLSGISVRIERFFTFFLIWICWILGEMAREFKTLEGNLGGICKGLFERIPLEFWIKP